MDISTAMNSPFLAEDPATTVSASNPNRPIPYHFKGLPTEYRQYVLDTQMQQAQATHQQKLEQKKDDAAWDDFMLKQNTEALKIETAIERERGNQRRELKNFLRVQAEETSAKREHDFSMLTSAPANSFFSQFGTSSR